jgi:hypothetical protein
MNTVLDNEGEKSISGLTESSNASDKVSTIANEEKSHGLNRDIEYAGVSRIEALCKCLLNICLCFKQMQILIHIIFRCSIWYRVEDLATLYLCVRTVIVDEVQGGCCMITLYTLLVL